jgi:hypothetical protein
VDASLAAAVQAAVSVPVVVELGSWAQLSSKVGLGAVLTSRMAGVMCELPPSRDPADIAADVAASKALLQKSSPTAAPAAAAVSVSKAAPVQLMSDADEALVAEEKQLLAEVTSFLEQVVPSLPELQVLRDAARALDELFLVVVRFTPCELLASPSELLASPSELLASPSELLASPSEILASPSELLASPSELLVSPSELLACHPASSQRHPAIS